MEKSIFFIIFVTSEITREKKMGYPTKIQLIKRAKSEQWYINFPSAIAQAMEFKRGEILEWLIEDRQKLLLIRKSHELGSDKKKQHTEQ